EAQQVGPSTSASSPNVPPAVEAPTSTHDALRRQVRLRSAVHSRGRSVNRARVSEHLFPPPRTSTCAFPCPPTPATPSRELPAAVCTHHETSGTAEPFAAFRVPSRRCSAEWSKSTPRLTMSSALLWGSGETGKQVGHGGCDVSFTSWVLSRWWYVAAPAGA